MGHIVGFPFKAAPRPSCLPPALEYLPENIPMAFTAFDLPTQLHGRLRNGIIMERINRELKRHSRVASIFPNTSACVRPVSAILA